MNLLPRVEESESFPKMTVLSGPTCKAASGIVFPTPNRPSLRSITAFDLAKLLAPFPITKSGSEFTHEFLLALAYCEVSLKAPNVVIFFEFDDIWVPKANEASPQLNDP